MPRRDAKVRVLVVDDKLEMAETLSDGLRDLGYEASAVASSREAAQRLEREGFDALVTDLRMPEIDGLGLLALSRRLDPQRPVIVMTAYGAIDTAIESIRQGAQHYLTKPFKLEELAIFLGRALEQRSVREEAAALKTTLKERYSPAGVVAQSLAMRAVLEVVERVARTDAPVLLLGETGTGKGLLARVIHAQSPRAARPFVTVNCAALPEALLESELFGHLKGAFTGATQDRPGLFAEAEGGTLCLDEMGELPPALQAKLLHVLESKTVRPVGSTRERVLDVRIIAATHRDLRARVKSGEFREDLLYRLDVVPIEVPPLRQRKDDLPVLLDQFLSAARGRHAGAAVERISGAALDVMLAHHWPGNVRELQHVIERLVVLGRSAEVQATELPATVREDGRAGAMAFGGDIVPVRELQRRYAQWALERCGGHRGRTAELLDIDGKTLAKWLGGE
ncbi:MAG: sigma-54-dependent Fis family transcriptional regulator [Archangiaceae bacterium]|nr:sigma-54-dependent Fis family transcriptional regulator [Archangiaceae bacterium]